MVLITFTKLYNHQHYLFSKSFYYHRLKQIQWTISGFPCSSVGKESACNAGDLGSIPGSGRSAGEGNGNPLQYSWLENPRDRGADWAAVYGVTQSQTRLMRLSSSSMEWMGGEWFGIFKSTLTPLRWWRTLCSMPYIWYFLPAFCLWKILVKVVSLSENYKCHIAKENCQRTWNNNNVVIKHRQGPVVPPQGQ